MSPRRKKASGQLDLFPAPPHCRGCDPGRVSEHVRFARSLTADWLQRMLELVTLRAARKNRWRPHHEYRRSVFAAEAQRRKDAPRHRALQAARAARLTCEGCATPIPPGGGGFCAPCAGERAQKRSPRVGKRGTSPAKRRP